MELNREQIIKALECCSGTDDDFLDVNCNKCPYKIGETSCRHLDRDALSLIKELTEENERLSGKVAEYEEERKYHFEMSRKRIAEAKADTVRKMHSEIKDRCIKEMLEDTK